MKWLSILLAAGCFLGFDQTSVLAQHTGFARTTQGTEYYQFAVDEEHLGGAPDRSTLNRPLGPQDRLFVRQGHFYVVGADGLANTSDDVRVRLFGINLSFAANFPEEREAAAYARRLRKLGFNAVRLHHLDFHLSDPHASQGETPNGILTQDPFPSFDERAIRRLRSFIRALSGEGLYINLNLHVSYRFRPVIDSLPPLDSGQERPAAVGTPIHFYYPPLIERQEQYARGLIRALQLGDDPVLAMVEINNESSLLDAWQSPPWRTEAWRDALPSAYAGELGARWRAWVIGQYGSLQAACTAWDRCDDPDVAALPASRQANVHDVLPAIAQRLTQGLGRILGASRPGGSGNGFTPEHRYQRDFLAFLVQMDRAYFDRLKAVIRSETHALVPVTGTQMGYGGVLNFDSHADLDYIDEHFYVGHPNYTDGNAWQSEDWRVPDTAASGKDIDRLLGLSLRRDASKPFVVSEYNQPFPAPQGSEILPLVATIAALQDWDGLFFFDYSNGPQPQAAPWYFSLSGNWGQYALTGQSAEIFRRPLLAALPATTPLPLSSGQRYALAIQGHINEGTLERHWADQLGLTPRHGWTMQLAETILEDGQVSADASTVLPGDPSHTPDGAVRQDAARQRIMLDAETVWGVLGQLAAGQSARGRFFGLRWHAGKSGSVQALITPLDGKPIAHAGRFLLSLGSHTTGTQPGSLPPRPKGVIPYPGKAGWLTLEPDPGSKGPSGQLGTRPPAWVARSDVELHVPRKAGRFAVHALDGAGQRAVQIPADLLSQNEAGSGTWVRLQATAETASLWYEIEMLNEGGANE